MQELYNHCLNNVCVIMIFQEEHRKFNWMESVRINDFKKKYSIN